MPQGSVLGPILFSANINNLCNNLSNAKYHFYADDTIMYSTSLAINVILSRLYDLKSVLNIDKTKLMVFSQSKVLPQNITNEITSRGKQVYIISVLSWIRSFIFQIIVS